MLLDSTYLDAMSQPRKLSELDARLYSWAMKQFGRRLREFRKSKGLSQADLARLAKIHPMQVGKYERGEGYPALETLVAIAKALHVSLDALLTGEEEPSKAADAFRFPMLEEKVRELDQELDKKDLQAVLSFLDAYIAKRRLRKLVS